MIEFMNMRTYYLDAVSFTVLYDAVLDVILLLSVCKSCHSKKTKFSMR